MEHVLTNYLFPDDGSRLVWNKILTFFDTQNTNEKMGWRINKILLFWLEKETGEFLTYLSETSRRENLIQNLLDSLRLGQCVVEILVGLCSVPDLTESISVADY